MLASEALSAVPAFVDGVFADALTTAGQLGWLELGAGASPVGCLSTGVAAVALVGSPGQRFAADGAAGRCHVAVTGRVLRH